MRRWLKEPLLHFLLLGASLFALHGWLSRGDGGGNEEAAGGVRLTAEEVGWLKESWTRQWRRAPTEGELAGLVADHLREKLLAREAEALKLGEGDIVIQRRLAQKMSFIVQDTARLAEPTEAELRGFYEADRARYSSPAKISFDHVYFSRERRGETRARADAEEALAGLNAGADPGEQGDPSLLSGGFEEAEQRAVAEQFGAGFAEALAAREPGGWAGPIESTFGWHAVRVRGRRAPAPMEFSEARDRVRDDWWLDRQRRAERAYLAQLMSKYRVGADESVRALLPSYEPAREGEGAR